MTGRRALSLTLCTLLLAVFPAGAQVLLLNPGTLTGNSTLLGTAPFNVSGGRWNNGGIGSYGSSLVYSTEAEGDATGVNVVVAGAGISLTGSGSSTTGSGTLNFTTGGVTYVGSETLNVFANRPAIDAVFSHSTATSPGMVGMRVGGLAAGIYDIYMAGAYVGDSTDNAQPGRSTPHAISMFAFTGSFDDTVDYTSAYGSPGPPGAGSVSAGSGSTSSFTRLSNSVNSSWTQGNNFAKFTLTLTGPTDYIYLIASGDRTLNNGTGGTSSENRGWLNLVQIVAVPEPGVGVALAFGLGLLAFARRRRMS